jgi:hypothetical protein
LARRVSVPGADELFRRTVVAGQGTAPAGQADDEAPHQAGSPDQQAPAAPSGRIRHDEKMTVYVTADELLDLEHARLTLRRAGLSVDRGRLVRDAIVMALADLEANGQDSMLVHRLTRR